MSLSTTPELPLPLPAPLDTPSLGAFPEAGLVRFRTFTTLAASCRVRLFDQRGEPLAQHPMQPLGGGYFEAVLPAPPEGLHYMFVVGGRQLPDPYARCLPFGVHGHALAAGSRYVWQHAPVARPLRDHVIYELHVGTFTDEGTYAAAAARLPALAELGVTALELMPLASFAGQRGWGYDGVSPFAPFAPYGTPDQLRAFVDAAHGLGLSVFLDVVYNHFGASGNYLGAYSPRYFTQAVRNGWGEAPDFTDPRMRRLVLDSARQWLEDYRMDGLRLDATHAIHDPSPTHILRELAEEAAAMEPARLLIAEDERNQPALVEELGLHGIWADDFHHQVRVLLTGEQDGYYAAYQPSVERLVETIRDGWLYQGQPYPPTGRPRGHRAASLPAEAFIYSIQNHDQVGNRALGDRLCHGTTVDAYCAVSALLLLLPMTPLLFMGQEWAASSPFQYFTDHDEELGRLVSKGRREEFRSFWAFRDPIARELIPDPQLADTFLRSRLRWDERDSSEHARVLSLYRKLLELRRLDPVLRAVGRAELEVSAHGPVLSVHSRHAAGDRVLLVNFDRGAVLLDELVPLVVGRPVLLRTDDRPPPPGALPGHTAILLGSRT